MKKTKVKKKKWLTKYRNAEKPHTDKQKLYFEYLLTGITQTEAAIKAGYAPSCAGSLASHNLDVFSNYWSELLRIAGCNDAKIAKTISEGLDATKVVGYLQKNNNDKSDKLSKDGKVKEPRPEIEVSNDFVDVPDFTNRAKFAEIALKLRNAYPKEQLVVEHKGDIGLKSDNFLAVNKFLKDMGEDARNAILGIITKALS